MSLPTTTLGHEELIQHFATPVFELVAAFEKFQAAVRARANRIEAIRQQLARWEADSLVYGEKREKVARRLERNSLLLDKPGRALSALTRLSTERNELESALTTIDERQLAANERVEALQKQLAEAESSRIDVPDELVSVLGQPDEVAIFTDR